MIDDIVTRAVLMIWARLDAGKGGEALVVEFLEGEQVGGDDVQEVVGFAEEPLRRVLRASRVKAEEARIVDRKRVGSWCAS